MAVVLNKRIVWCNCPFSTFAETLGDGNLNAGISYLQQHFADSTHTNPLNAAAGPRMSQQQIQGATRSSDVECNIWCVSGSNAEYQQYLWVMRSKKVEAPSCQPLVVSDPELADPRVKIVMESTTNKRKHPSSKPVFTKHNLWNKYGCKAVSVKRAEKGAANVKVKRSYYKCVSPDCLAKLTVDAEPETNKQLKITSSGRLSFVLKSHMCCLCVAN